jgi:hypothetical protein
MYYLVIFSILSTVIVLMLKYFDKNTDGQRNCSEYLDSYENLTIETNSYIYKMSRTNGRLFRRRKNSNKNYILVQKKGERLKAGIKQIILNPINGDGFEIR